VHHIKTAHVCCVKDFSPQRAASVCRFNVVVKLTEALRAFLLLTLPLLHIYFLITTFVIQVKVFFQIVQMFQGMRKSRINTPGRSYVFRLTDVVRIYDEHSRSGLSNREIFRRYIWPKYRICERTFYNMIKASADDRVIARQREMQMTLF
jgi:hypothetical protein